MLELLRSAKKEFCASFASAGSRRLPKRCFEHITAPDSVTPVRLQHTHAAVPVSRWGWHQQHPHSPTLSGQSWYSSSAAMPGIGIRLCPVCARATFSRALHAAHQHFCLGYSPMVGVMQLPSWVLRPASAHKDLLGMRLHPTILGWPGLTDPGLMRKSKKLLIPVFCNNTPAGTGLCMSAEQAAST